MNPEHLEMEKHIDRSINSMRNLVYKCFGGILSVSLILGIATMGAYSHEQQKQNHAIQENLVQQTRVSGSMERVLSIIEMQAETSTAVLKDVKDDIKIMKQENRAVHRELQQDIEDLRQR